MIACDLHNLNVTSKKIYLSTRFNLILTYNFPHANFDIHFYAWAANSEYSPSWLHAAPSVSACATVLYMVLA